MGYKRHKCIYQGGNDHAIPDSAFVPTSWVDGIYSHFSPVNAPDGWPDVQNWTVVHWEESGALVYLESGSSQSGALTDGFGNDLIFVEEHTRRDPIV